MSTAAAPEAVVRTLAHPTRRDFRGPGTGAITDRVDFAEWPSLAKLTDWAIDAHMGALFGLHPAAVMLLIVGVVAIGWTLPLLGLSLAAFVVIDLIAGVPKRRKADTRSTEDANT